MLNRKAGVAHLVPLGSGDESAKKSHAMANTTTATCADVLEVLIGQMAESCDTDSVFGEALRILGHAEFFEPIYNLLHRGTLPGITPTA